MIEIYITLLTHIIILICFFNFLIFRYFNAKHDQTSFPYKYLKTIIVVVVQLVNCVRLFAAPWTVARQAFLSFTTFWSD